MINSDRQQSQFNQDCLHDKCQEPKITKSKQAFSTESELAEAKPLASQDLLSWFWSTHSQFSSFRCGVFWGLIISLTAIVSGLIGASLITVIAVRSNFVSQLNNNQEVLLSNNQNTNLVYKLLRHYQQKLFVNPEPKNLAHHLNRPINLLLIGIKPHQQAVTTSPTVFVGESQTMWLLRFQPERNLVKVINIPLNSLVQIPGFGQGTIKDAHKYGGTPLVSQAVSQLLDNINIDAYIKATPKALDTVLPILGEIPLNCSVAIYSQDKNPTSFAPSRSQASKLDRCRSKSAQFQQQQLLWETMAQKLQRAAIRDRLPRTILTANQYLDTNISPHEILVLTDFIAQLPPAGLKVSLLSNKNEPQVTSEVESLIKSGRFFNRGFSLANSPSLNQQKTSVAVDKWRNVKIAVQNTTDDPQLSLRVISYLTQQGFEKVYLTEHLPLNLARTEIVLPQSKINLATYLKQVLGMGRLEVSKSQHQKVLTIRIGKDAQNLIPNDSFIRENLNF